MTRWKRPTLGLKFWATVEFQKHKNCSIFNEILLLQKGLLHKMAWDTCQLNSILKLTSWLGHFSLLWYVFFQILAISSFSEWYNSFETFATDKCPFSDPFYSLIWVPTTWIYFTKLFKRWFWSAKQVLIGSNVMTQNIV